MHSNTPSPKNSKRSFDFVFNFITPSGQSIIVISFSLFSSCGLFVYERCTNAL